MFSTQKYYTIATQLSVLTILLAMLYGYRNIQIDDSYIFYSYAQNLASGNGYVFNIGERINATTSPLYTILLALASVILQFLPFITLPLIGHTIGIICLFFFCLFLFRSFKTETSSIFHFIVPIVFLLNPLLLNSIGMETFLAMMLAMISICFYIQNNFLTVSIFCSLAVLARPDMLILVAVIVSYDFIKNRRLPSISNIIIFLLPIFIWLLFSFMYFGDPLPSTFSVKLYQTQLGIWGTGLVFLKGLFATAIWQGNPILRNAIIVVVVLGFVVFVLRFRGWSLFRHPAFHLILLWNLAYLAIYGFILNPPSYIWYYTPLSIGMAILISLLIEAIYRFLSDINKIKIGIVSAAIFLVLVIIGIIRPLKSSFGSIMPNYDNYKLAAEWLNANTTTGTSVGAIQIGVLRYYYKNGTIIDGLGLVTPGVSEHVRQQDYSWYIHHYKPDYLMLNYPHRKGFEAMVESDWFQEEYVLRTTVNVPKRRVAIYERQNHKISGKK